MTCQDCDDLRERIAWLEGELGVQNAADDIERLRRAMPHKTPSRLGAARFIMALYNAKGRTLTPFQMLEAMPPQASRSVDDRDPNIVAVWACHARDGLGREHVENVWGRGYRLTTAGMARVAAILEPNPRPA